MDQIHLLLNRCALFQGMQEDELSSLLRCLGPQKREYPSGSVILTYDQSATAIGVVLTGLVQVLQDDHWGNRTIVAKIGPGESFAESFACAGAKGLPVSIIAEKDCSVLFLNYHKVLSACSNACVFHQRLIENLLHVLAEKNIFLNQRLQVLARRRTKEKILTYLTFASQAAGSHTFTIPLNRQELADYLCVDRSALSSALSQLQKEGCLRFNRNKFTLY